MELKRNNFYRCRRKMVANTNIGDVTLAEGLCTEIYDFDDKVVILKPFGQKIILDRTIFELNFREVVSMNDETKVINKKISDIYAAMSDMQIYKNTQYGNIGSQPLEIFTKFMGSDSIALNGIYQRLDDKLSRIKNCQDNKPRINDVVDVMGYLNLLLVNMGVTPEDIAKFKD